MEEIKEYTLKYWWTFLLRGIFGIILGILILSKPAEAFAAFVFAFALFVLLQGILLTISSITNRKDEMWLLFLLEGILGVIVGTLALKMPGMTAIILFLFAFAWALTSGIFQIATAISMRKYVKGEWALLLNGILSIIFAAILIIYPITGIMALVMVTGFYLIIFGILQIILSLNLRKFGESPEIPISEA